MRLYRATDTHALICQIGTYLPNRPFQRYDHGRYNAVELRLTADNGSFSVETRTSLCK